MNTQRNNTLDLLKLLASYMVVFIHVAFYGKAGTIIECLARFAVPLFFLTSGFYSYQIGPQKIKKRITKTLKLLIFAAICYTIFNTSARIISGNIDAVVLYFKRYIDVVALVKLFVFNVSLTAGHFWFLLALIYVYVIFYFVAVLCFNQRAIYIIASLLLLLQVCLGEILPAVGIVVPEHFLRNYALMGIPFFTLGLVAKKHEDKLQRIPNYVAIVCVMMGGLASLCSRHILGKSELYIGSLFILFGLVCVFVKYANVQHPSFLTAMEECSTYIFVFHAMVSVVIDKIYSLFGVDTSVSIIHANLRPIFVCIGSTVLAYFITQIQKRRRKA